MALNKKTTNEFGVISSHDGKGNFSNNYNEQTPAQRDAMFKSNDNDNTPAAATTQMASVVNAALGKTGPKTWGEFTSGTDLDSLSDAQWRKKHESYSNYLLDDKFGLVVNNSALPAHEELMKASGQVRSSYSNAAHRDQEALEVFDQAKYDKDTRQFEKLDFDKWLAVNIKNGRDDLANSDYVGQREEYKRQVDQNLGMSSRAPAHVKQKTFEEFDPGLFTAGDDYGQFSGAYRTQDEADTKFQGYYTGELDKLGYGNLATEGLGNAGYVSALEDATNRKGISDQISGLGYGSMVNPNMTADQLNAAFGEATERNKFKDLLDGMGTEYGTMDSASSLGSLYDTTTKLNAATEAARQQQQQQQGMAVANAVAADKAQRQNVGIASIPGPSASPYTAAAAPTGTTALQDNPYQMAPIDFTGGLAGAGSDGTVGQTNIFAPPQMSMTQSPFDLNQSFNPYFDALNTQYGIPPVQERPPFGGALPVPFDQGGNT